MYSFKTNIEEKEYKQFTKNYKYTSFMQEPEWAKVKDNWDNILCGVYKDKKLVGVCSILIRKLFKNIKMFYIPRGYLLDFTDKDLLSFMTENIKKLAKEYKAYVVKIDPNFCVSEKKFKNQQEELKNYSIDYDMKHQNLINLGYHHTGFCTDLHHNFQPRYNMSVPLIDDDNNLLSFDEVLKTFKSKFRYYLGNYHEKRGVFYTHSFDKKDVPELVKLLRCTEQTKGINLRSEEYFNKIMDNFPNRACILFGKLDLEKYLDFLENNKGKDQEIDEVKNLIKTQGRIITLSSALMILPDTEGLRTSEYLYAGNNLRFAKLRVSGGIATEAVKISIEHKCHYCNLGGIDGTLTDSLTNFKSKFNAIIWEFAGEYDLVINKFQYKFIKTFYPVLTKIYKIIKK